MGEVTPHLDTSGLHTIGRLHTLSTYFRYVKSSRKVNSMNWTAFLRRIRFVVQFPFPDAVAREAFVARIKATLAA